MTRTNDDDLYKSHTIWVETLIWFCTLPYTIENFFHKFTTNRGKVILLWCECFHSTNHNVLLQFKNTVRMYCDFHSFYCEFLCNCKTWHNNWTELPVLINFRMRALKKKHQSIVKLQIFKKNWIFSSLRCDLRSYCAFVMLKRCNFTIIAVTLSPR